MSQKRPVYYTGQLLSVDDLTCERDYHANCLREHTRHAHTWGVIEGLDFSPPANDLNITITPGSAVDSLGRTLALTGADFIFDISGYNFSGNAAVYITIAYQETQTDPVTTLGMTGNSRIEETVLFQASATAPADPSLQLVLGIVQLNANGDGIISHSTAPPVRTMAGTLVPHASAASLEIKTASTNDKAVLSASELTGSYTVHIDSEITSVTGDLEVTGDLTMANTVPVAPDVAAITLTGDLNVGGTATFSESAVFQGNLTVLGSTSQVNTTDLNVSDNIVQVNSNSPAVPDANLLSGLEVYRGSDTGNYPPARLLWDEALLSWKFGTTAGFGAQFHHTGNATLNTSQVGDSLSGATTAGFSHKDLAGTSSYALMQSSDGLDTAVKTAATNSIKIQIGGVDQLTIKPDGSIDITGEDIIEPWINPTLATGWSNSDTPDDVFGYCKDSNNVVYLRGRVDGSTPSTIFTLPAGYRPAGELRYVIVDNANNGARLDILADGQIVLGYGATTMVSLDGIMFVAVQ